jgi:hypothetical protein
MAAPKLRHANNLTPVQATRRLSPERFKLVAVDLHHCSFALRTNDTAGDYKLQATGVVQPRRPVDGQVHPTANG